MDLTYILTSTEGRLRRKHFWIGLIILIVGAIILSFVLGIIAGVLFEPTSIAIRFVGLLISLAMLFPAYAVYAKRFQDRNKNPQLALIGPGLGVLNSLLTVVGITGNGGALDMVFAIALIGIGIWYLIDLGILDGTVGPNAYGPDPKAAERPAL